MYGWSFSARTVEEVARLLRAMGKHRYLAETDLRLHWVVDRALAKLDLRAAEQVERFKIQCNLAPEMALDSRDLRLWRRTDVQEVVSFLEWFWTPGEAGDEARLRLAAELRSAGFPVAAGEPFETDVEESPHPELILLDWVLLPVDQLDADHHRVALRAMEDSGDEVDASAPIYVEAPILGEPELCRGSRNGLLPAEPIFWADGPYSYCDYVFRGVSKAAKLVDPPVGYLDVDKG